MKKQTDYEIDKQIRKQRLVRNEFLYYGNSASKYEFPIIRKQDIDASKIEFLSYVDAKNDDKENSHKTIHFFTYDWKFEKVYKNADDEIQKLSQYYALLSPDFSMFTNMPLALQIESVFKNRWCGAYWQSKGLKVIPTVSWGDRRSFDFCFEGIEEGAIVAVSTYYRENCEMDFMLGYEEMIKRIKPSMVLCYDEPFNSMTGNIKEFLPTTYEWTKKLNWKDLVQFKWEKHNRNVLGLNPSDFRFFDYDDPHEKIDIKRCDVCGEVVAIDQFGIGDCEKCGWIQDPKKLNNPDRVEFPNRVSLNKARRLFEKGKKLEPDIDDFIAGLLMYSEMQFCYGDKKYGVIRLKDGIEFFDCEDAENPQIYLTTDEFKEKATINGKLLKEIWQGVFDADYMYE